MKKEFLNLGKQPITNAFITKKEFDKEYYYNLSIVYDTQTKMVSLKEQVKPELMFNHTYAHRASQSYTMMNAFKKVAKYLDKNFRPKLILETTGASE